ncbi:MAG TPA: VOC family protein, partial [Gammaproteobacteria bacterium]
ASVELAVRLGGDLLAGPFDAPGIGRSAALRDPEGALFSVITGADPERLHLPTRAPGQFCWHELHARDPASMASFYAALFDWRAETVRVDGRDYRVLHCGDAPVAGIANAAGEREPHWRVYVEVADVAAAVRGARALGGRLLRPVSELAAGHHALIGDPQGAVIALFETRPGRGHA